MIEALRLSMSAPRGSDSVQVNWGVVRDLESGRPGPIQTTRPVLHTLGHTIRWNKTYLAMAI